MSTRATGAIHILVALTLCMVLQMTGFAMILPLFAAASTAWAGAQALAMSSMPMPHPHLARLSRACWPTASDAGPLSFSLARMP